MDSFSAGLLFGFILGAVSTWPAYVVYAWLTERRKWRRRAELDPTLERLRRLSRPQPKNPDPTVSERFRPSGDGGERLW